MVEDLKAKKVKAHLMLSDAGKQFKGKNIPNPLGKLMPEESKRASTGRMRPRTRYPADD